MQKENVYYVYQGKLNGTLIGKQNEIVAARGPLTAAKLLFPNRTIRKATQKEIWGSASQSLQFSCNKGNMQFNGKPVHKSPDNWIQLNHCNKDESYFFIIE